MAVYKYLLSLNGIVQMPEGAQVLCVQAQREQPCIWALVNPDAPKVERHFRIVGTGYLFNEPSYTYVGTFQLSGGSLVFHVFEVPA